MPLDRLAAGTKAVDAGGSSGAKVAKEAEVDRAEGGERVGRATPGVPAAVNPVSDASVRNHSAMTIPPVTLP